MTEQMMTAFQQSLRGRLIRPDDTDYDAVRALYNGMIDKRPRLIARCVDVADVIAAVNFAREQGLLLAIRGGGHNGPGLGSCNDGLVIDLSGMRGIHGGPLVNSVAAETMTSVLIGINRAYRAGHAGFQLGEEGEIGW